MPIFLALILAQAGPLVSPGAAPPIPPPPVERRARPAAEAPGDRLADCIAAAETSAEEALDAAELWLGQTQGSARAGPFECIGAAHAALGRWSEAEGSFAAARDAAAISDKLLRARLGGMAGNAALAAGAGERALALLAAAQAEAAEKPSFAGTIAIDRARALVALNREAEAEAPLTEARTLRPDDAEAWLLSATLSRRLGKLEEAQARIERAAQLLPIDPEIGLEAGVIAILSGRHESARKSWQSVIAAAPGSTSAVVAQAYLDQLDAPQTPAKP